MEVTMIIILHRVNKIEELKKVDPKYGVEIDIRHDNKNGRLYLNHDPGEGDDFEEYIKICSEKKIKFVIFNIKEAGIENQVISLAEKYKIENYFLLDVEFPFIFRSVNNKKLKGRLAIRYSEAEPIEQALVFSGKYNWVWIDTNTKLPLDKGSYKQLKSVDYRSCLVCPERWGRPEDIDKYISFMKENGIKLDAVMTNIKYVNNWEKF